jgi:hypothetical protein
MILSRNEFRVGMRRSHLVRVPVVGQPTCFLESTRTNALTVTFRVWSRHSRPRFAENEGLCCLRELACLMGSLTPHTCNVSGRSGCRSAETILETGQSAAYSSLRRKTSQNESGERPTHALGPEGAVLARGAILGCILACLKLKHDFVICLDPTPKSKAWKTLGVREVGRASYE